MRPRFVVERLQVELALQNRLHALLADGAAVQGSRTGTLHALQWIALRMTRESATHAIPPESVVVVWLPRPMVAGDGAHGPGGCWRTVAAVCTLVRACLVCPLGDFPDFWIKGIQHGRHMAP